MRKKIILFMGCILALLSMRAETVPQTQSVLRSYFTTGSVPSETNYWELIDTMFYYASQSDSNSAAAAASAQAAQTFFLASGDVTLHVSGTNVTCSVTNLANVSSVSVTNYEQGYNGGYTTYAVSANIAFANSLEGTNYSVKLSAPASSASYTTNVYVITGPLLSWGFFSRNTTLITNANYSSTTNAIVSLWTVNDLNNYEGAHFKFYLQ